MTAQPRPYLTETEYLERERESIAKHEYYAGEVFAMSGASEAHNLIASNVNASLYNQLRGRGYRIYPSDMRIKVVKKEYILIAQNKHHIERYVRSEAQTWVLSEAVGLESSIVLDSIQCTLALADTYELVDIPPESPSADRAGTDTREHSAE
jgi:Uma2 family endonuclease